MIWGGSVYSWLSFLPQDPSVVSATSVGAIQIIFFPLLWQISCSTCLKPSYLSLTFKMASFLFLQLFANWNHFLQWDLTCADLQNDLIILTCRVINLLLLVWFLLGYSRDTALDLFCLANCFCFVLLIVTIFFSFCYFFLKMLGYLTQFITTLTFLLLLLSPISDLVYITV